MLQTLHLGRFCFRRLIVLALTLTCACGAPPARSVGQVSLEETSKSDVNRDEVLAGLVTAAPRKLLWIVRERDSYDEALLARDLERIERFYRARGYYDAKVIAARVIAQGEHEVAVEIRITPGPRVTVRRRTIEGLASAPPGTLAAVDFYEGDAFDERLLDQTKQELERVLHEQGYAFAKIVVKATVDLNAQAADVSIKAELGPLARYGPIRIEGLREIPERKVREIFGLEPGDRFSQSAQDDAEQELGRLRVFSRVKVIADASHPETATVPVQVVVEEDKLRRVRLGGGASIDPVRLEAHLRTGWEHANFLGGARKFSVEAKPGVDFFPNRLEDPLASPTPLFEGDLRVELVQPAFIEARTTGFLRADYRISPVLLPLPDDAIASREVIVGYQQLGLRAGLRRGFVRRLDAPDLFTFEPSYNWQANLPFAYQNRVSNDLSTVRVSFPELQSTIRTSERDYARLWLTFSNKLQVASKSLGGTLSDLRIEPELRVTVPVTPHTVRLSPRLKLGFLFPFDYGDSLKQGTRDGTVAIIDPQDPAVIRDQQKLFFRAFYSGGLASNRGYIEQAISPHGAVGYLTPSGVNCSLSAGGDVDSLASRCIRPLGGFSLWEASVDLSFRLNDSLRLVTFVDTSDVSRGVGRIEFGFPHLSVGPGVRYETIVGTLGFDVGIRVPRAQAWGKKRLPLEHGQEHDLFGLPIALHLGMESPE